MTLKQGRKIIGMGILFLVLTAFDQWTKWMCILHLKGHDLELIPDVFELHYLENRGAAFGMLQNQRILLLLITFLFFGVVVYLLCRIPSERRYLPMQTVLVVLLSGAVGNMADRVFRGYVVDFFYFKLINYPVFNVADCYVVIAAVVAVILVLFVYQDDDFGWIKRK